MYRDQGNPHQGNHNQAGGRQDNRQPPAIMARPGGAAADGPLDLRGRPMRDLRISLTDRCNFRCSYCMPAEIFGPDYAFMETSRLLTFDEIERLTRLFRQLGVRKIRLTGGEPLLRRDLPDLVGRLTRIDGIEDLAITTNGALLSGLAQPLKEAGLRRITVSLDSLDQARFALMSGTNVKVEQILAGIDRAAAAGLAVKVNMVVKRGANDQDILPLARYCRERGLTLRFIEFMDVGNSNGWRLEHVVPSREIARRIHEVMPIEPIDPNYYGEVAERCRYAGSGEEIGFISSVTQAFCSSCTRARLTADGSFFTCLFASQGLDLRELLRRGCSDEQVLEAAASCWLNRSDHYSEIRMAHTAKDRKKVEMHRIGG